MINESLWRSLCIFCQKLWSPTSWCCLPCQSFCDNGIYFLPRIVTPHTNHPLVSYHYIVDSLDHFWCCWPDSPFRIGVVFKTRPATFKHVSTSLWSCRKKETSFFNVVWITFGVKPFVCKYSITAIPQGCPFHKGHGARLCSGFVTANIMLIWLICVVIYLFDIMECPQQQVLIITHFLPCEAQNPSIMRYRLPQISWINDRTTCREAHF